MNQSDEVKNRIAEVLATAAVHDSFFVPVLREIVSSLRDTDCTNLVQTITDLQTVDFQMF